MDPFSPDLLWMVIIGFIIAFVLAFGIGANDVANSFGTSVGSGVLTIRQACILATICEISGAVLIGYKVSDTMRKGILEVSLYSGFEEELMLGCVSALASSAIWLLVATFLKLPISGTHSIVGSTIGFSLVARGTKGLQWSTLMTIVGSWFVSPVLSGCVSILLFMAIRKLILRAKDPLKAGFRSLPIFYGVTFFINVISVVLDGPKLLYMDNIPTWVAIVSSVGLGLLIAILTQLVIVPMQKRKIAKQLRAKNPVKFNIESSVESSPSGSPKKNRRPLSLVSDGKPLPAIAEITELVSLTDNSPKTYKLTPYSLTGKAPISETYKIPSELIKKAEDLLGKASLDNTDLTITSLNYIDEQNQNGCNGISLKNGKTTKLEDCFKHLDTLPHLQNGQNSLSDGSKLSTNSNNITNTATQELPNYESCLAANNNTTPLTNKTISNNTNKQNNNSYTAGGASMDVASNNVITPASVLTTDSVKVDCSSATAKKSIKEIESGASLDIMISSTLSPNSSKVPLIESKEALNELRNADDEHLNGDETEEVGMLFSFLQILTATFGSFAHGGNDVSNAIGPLIALYMIYRDGSVMQEAESSIYILIYGGIGISIGLWLWGRRVIETIGSDLTKITASTGFTIEVGAAITVLVASKIGLPISTTHCKVGSVVFVGHVSAAGRRKKDAIIKEQNATLKSVTKDSSTSSVIEMGMGGSEGAGTPGDASEKFVSHMTPPSRADGSVDWHLFRNIAYAWIVTVPVTAALSAGLMSILRLIVLK